MFVLAKLRNFIYIINSLPPKKHKLTFFFEREPWSDETVRTT